MIFRAITFGGFAGQTYETNLFENGRVVRVLVNPDGTTSQPQTKQISELQVEQFKKLLKQEFEQFSELQVEQFKKLLKQEFEQFNNLS